MPESYITELNDQSNMSIWRSFTRTARRDGEYSRLSRGVPLGVSAYWTNKGAQRSHHRPTGAVGGRTKCTNAVVYEETGLKRPNGQLLGQQQLRETSRTEGRGIDDPAYPTSQIRRRSRGWTLRDGFLNRVLRFESSRGTPGGHLPAPPGEPPGIKSPVHLRQPS
jgi:hypothetical protein